MFISPMLLHRSKEPFNDDAFITELKLDGIRLILSKIDDKIRLYTRHNNDVTSLFPELLNVEIPDGTILDGELIVTDQKGKPDFEAMMERFQSKRSTHPVSYSVFDVIHYNNANVSYKPLIERKEILDKIIKVDTPLINKVMWMYGKGVDYFDVVKDHDLEGIVIKNANSLYKPNTRSQEWLKVINYKYTNAYVGGLRKGDFGVMLMDKEGEYLGLMEFMPIHERKVLYAAHKSLISHETDSFIYLKPELQIKVKYRNLTKKGLLRIPSFEEWI
ncbi:RNA ligase family protein [Rossellomorea marisflavi]|uniref:ATP-dependent DNA ligase n=1 Tax=Rossellomorea marisflavi TaxID=189381 RepID=UPI0025B20087|nr:RNA ligase family protein [Rossellomorea marisflavi]WJV20771.1 RNA ligase family protein [Rossellomorea marisflavi]